MESKDLQRLLEHDAIDEAERETETSYKDGLLGDLVVWRAMGKMQDVRKVKDAELTSRLDSTFSSDLEYYVRVIEAEGFSKILELDVPPTDRDKGDKFFVYWHGDGILLAFDTYWGGKSVNGGNFYFNLRLNEPDKYCDLRCSQSRSRKDTSVMVGHFDCREAIRFHIAQLREHGTLVRPWIERPFLWLLHYQDSKVVGYDYAAINAERIAMLPQEVQAAITPVAEP